MLKQDVDAKAVSLTLVRRIWPEEYQSNMRPFARGTRAIQEISILGGNKALGAMQFVRADMAKWASDLTKGWPAKREAWEVQGYRVLAPGEYTAAGREQDDGTTRMTIRPKEGRGSWSTSFTVEQVTNPPFLLVQDGGFGAEAFATREAAMQAAREKVKRQSGVGQDIRGTNIEDAERTGPARREEGEDITAQQLMDVFGFRGVNFGREGWINQAERQAYLNQAYDGLLDLAELLGVPPKAMSLDGALGIAFGAQGKGKAAAHFVPGVNEINLTKTKGAGTLAHEWGHALDHYFATQAGLSKDAEPMLSEHAHRGDTGDRMVFEGGKYVNKKGVPTFGEGIRLEIVQAFRQIHQAMMKRAESLGEANMRRDIANEQATAMLGRWIKSARRAIEGSNAENKADLLAEFDQHAEKLMQGDTGDGYEQAGKQLYSTRVAAIRNLIKDATGRMWSNDETKGLESTARYVRNLLAKKDADTTHEPQLVGTQYKIHSAAMDKAKGGKAYWSTPTEMFARAFELYVHDKLSQQGNRNTFLTDAEQRASTPVQVADSSSPMARASGGTRDLYLYPVGKERETLREAFDSLVGTMQTRETERGVALFDISRAPSYHHSAIPDAVRANALAKLKELERKRDAETITEDDYRRGVQELITKIEQRNEARVDRRIEAGRRRGADWIIAQLRRGVADQTVPRNEAEFAEWLLEQNPNLANDLGISITQKDGEGAAGEYRHLARIVKLFSSGLGNGTTVHEILHHTERMMPGDVQDGVLSEWQRAWDAAHKAGDAKLKAALEDMLAASLGNKRAHDRVKARFADGTLTYDQHYQLFSPSEFWAVNATRILSGRYQAKGSWVKRAQQWFREFVQHMKALLGLRSDAPILKALDAVMAGNGEFVTKQLLAERVSGMVQDEGPSFRNISPRNSLGNTPPQPVGPGQSNRWTVAKASVMRLTSPEVIDKLIYEFQDKMIDLKRIRDHIKALGGTVTDLNDAYLGEELFHKRLAKRTEDFLADELKPLLAQMRSAGVKLPEFEQFLHARHAPEANAALAKRNPNRTELDAIKAKADADVKALQLQLQSAKAKGTATKAIEDALQEAQDEANKWKGAQAFRGTEAERLALSGMSDDDAAAHMQSLAPGKRQHLEALAAKVDAMNAKTLDLLERYGLMDKATLDAWRNAYRFYVPLHREEAHPDSKSHPAGAGFSVKGSASRQRTGSTEKVTNILGHIAMQREAALNRGEKNHVAKKLYLLAAQNPDDDLWEVDKPPMIKTLDSSTGTVRQMVDPAYKSRPNVLMVRIGGKDVAIVFNEHNPQAMRMVEALKNMDVGDLHVVLGLTAKATRWFASVNTQYNPIFGLINFARDVQSGLLNLSTTELSGKQLEVAQNIPAAMRAVYRKQRGKGAANAQNQQWIDLWNEMQNVGGATGYRDLYTNAEERAKALQKELEALERGEVSKAAHAVLDWLSHYNEAMENAVRVAAYKAALDQGMSKERAASLAKNLTVNFNRKGRQAREIGALYAFFNAAIQGTARMADTLKGPLGKKIMLGGATVGAVNALLGMAMMGGGDGEDDNWERIPEFIKERSLIIPLGREDYLTVPLPLGFHVLPNIGRLSVEFMLGGPDKTMGKQLGKLLASLTDAFNPLGGSQNMGQMVAPTVIDPVVALMQNRDWTGRPIYRENRNPLDPTPGHARAKDSASTVSKGIAKGVNAITGGTEYRPGMWSPTPDQLDYVIGQLTGGLGRELLKVNQTLTAPLTGDELPPYKIPLVGRLYGNTRGPAGQSEAFFQNVTELNEIENEMRGRQLAGADARGYMASEPLSKLVGMGNAAEANITKLRQVRREVVRREQPGYQDKVREIDQKIGEVMTNLNREVSKARREAAQ